VAAASWSLLEGSLGVALGTLLGAPVGPLGSLWGRLPSVVCCCGPLALSFRVLSPVSSCLLLAGVLRPRLLLCGPL
jgi:hypothetical protein